LRNVSKIWKNIFISFERACYVTYKRYGIAYMNRADSSRHKPVFHFNRIVPKRSVFLCFLSASVELMTSTQKKMLRHVTIRLKWKTGLSTSLKMFVTRINPIGLTIARLIYYVYKLTLREFIHWDKYLAVHTYTHLMIACRESLAWCWQFPTIICFSARTYVFFSLWLSATCFRIVASCLF
jgi:hypothetical protein